MTIATLSILVIANKEKETRACEEDEKDIVAGGGARRGIAQRASQYTFSSIPSSKKNEVLRGRLKDSQQQDDVPDVFV
jgi:hypothetical protein